MTPLHYHQIGRGILAHHPSGPQHYIASLGDCMELVTCPNECFVQVGFRIWPLHMRMSHTYVPTHATAAAPPHGHTHASRSTPAPAHATAHAPAPAHAHATAHTNSGSTCVTPKWGMPLEIRPSHALPLCACGTPKPTVSCGGLQPCHPPMLSCFMAKQN
ncbi:hypothetical protein O181_071730 [Austropuccinia psidii MF-1]|uniref:Uncharacterized protein n=1 Tax=Austropuccinia psidii MF-1 TaxID=1389203 RepID=A0A9Q3IAB1_9BASI|nr:hypothetical protein [Austropuccinia psidii MF-1]